MRVLRYEIAWVWWSASEDCESVWLIVDFEMSLGCGVDFTIINCRDRVDLTASGKKRVLKVNPAARTRHRHGKDVLTQTDGNVNCGTGKK